VSERARDRRRRVKPVAEAKTQTGARGERRGGTRQFVQESAAELKKVEWPNQRQLVSATVVVIIAIAVVGFYLWVADEVFSRLVRDVLLR
jgi:preprotein translocase subunit SecE